MESLFKIAFWKSESFQIIFTTSIEEVACHDWSESSSSVFAFEVNVEVIDGHDEMKDEGHPGKNSNEFVKLFRVGRKVHFDVCSG